MPTTAETKRAAVLGWPVGHSLSPRLHGFWLAQYGVNGSYEALGVEPKDLQKTLRSLAEAGYAGMNLTLPHKEAAVKYVDAIDEAAEGIGAINTIVIRDGKLYGSNTDGYGFMSSLKSHGVNFAGGRALVLGAGGAARAVGSALLGEGSEIIIANRTFDKADRLAQGLGGKALAVEWAAAEDAMSDVTLLVNTTPLGMKGQEAFALSIDRLNAQAVVTDVVYAPLLTPLLRAAAARGHKTVDGLGMLLYQAQPGFEAWFGVRPEVTQALRDHVLAGMA